MRNSNNFSSSNCQVNQYCNFAKCKTQNTPYNVNNTALQHTISSCGAIDSPGVYTLGSNLVLTNQVNLSNPLSSKSSCIYVNAPQVRLNCANLTISNAYYGVLVSGLYNTSVVNCGFTNDTYGLYLKGTIGTNAGNIRVQNNIYGIYLNGTTGAVLNGVNAHNNLFGIYFNGASGTSVYGVNSNNNGYGVYVNGAQGNDYYTGNAYSNTNADLYCSASSYNTTQNFVKSLTCGSTDCQWAMGSCSKQLNAPLLVTPISSCTTIVNPGNYSMNGGILSQNKGTCMTIAANGVTFNCNNHFINGVGQGFGTAFNIQGTSNVTINGCSISNFRNGVVGNNTAYIKLENLNISNVNYGIYQSNSIYETIQTDSVSTFSSAAYSFNALNNTVVTGDSASSGTTGAPSFAFSNSYKNLIANNYGSNAGPYAFTFNRSRTNTISNNTAVTSTSTGYYCDAPSSGLFAQQNGVNYGVGKVGCIWMVEVNREIPQNCGAIMSSSTVVLSQDMLYTYGGSCYSVSSSNQSSANNTVINCAGHTVLSNSGGTFVNVGNAQGVTVENCYIKNFTTAVSSSSIQGPSVINNTISNVKNGVVLQNGNYSHVSRNRILNASYGVVAATSPRGLVISNNIFAGDNVSMQLTGVYGWTLNNNTATGGSIGVYLINSQIGAFQNDILTSQSQASLLCTSGAGNLSSLNRDLGGNICSTEKGCAWTTISPKCG